MRDEGDLHAQGSDDFPWGINCRALLIATAIGWLILGLVAVGVLKLFHHA